MFQSDVATTITEFGINNAIVEVNIRLKVNVQIIVPFASKTATVEQTIPVAIGLTREPSSKYLYKRWRWCTTFYRSPGSI